MNRVFISGSRKITRLSPEVRARLDNIAKSGFTVLIGDANGADKAVQSYFAQCAYPNVVVFCAGGICRNNVGGWQIRGIAPNGKRGFEFYAAKDLAMAQEATHGFMLWDAKSKGTLNNMLNMLKLSKKALVFFTPEQEFYNLADFNNLQQLLTRCAPMDLEKFASELPLSSFGLATTCQETLFAA